MFYDLFQFDEFLNFSLSVCFPEIASYISVHLHIFEFIMTCYINLDTTNLLVGCDVSHITTTIPFPVKSKHGQEESGNKRAISNNYFSGINFIICENYCDRILDVHKQSVRHHQSFIMFYEYLFRIYELLIN